MKSQFGKLVVLGSFVIVAASVSAVTEVAWTGGAGDSDATKAANWDGVNAFPKADNDYALTIDKDGAEAVYQTANWNGGQHGSFTVGGAANQSVTMKFVSVRKGSDGKISNRDTAGLNLDGLFTVLGENTTIDIEEGFQLRLKGSFANPCWSFDSNCTFKGEGVLQFQQGTQIPGKDYDGLWLYLGYDNGLDVSYTLTGALKTAGKLRLSHDSYTGDRLDRLNLAGFDVEVGSVELGALDMKSDAVGNQSNFGGITLNGATMKVAGDFACVGDPDGVSNTGAALTRDSFLSTGGKASRLELGGSIVLRDRSTANWNLNGLTLVMNGDGSAVQTLEAASRDAGDGDEALEGNVFLMDALTVCAGAKVQLVDVADNDRTDAEPECVYVRNLMVESDAELDLNGITLYVRDDSSVVGSVVNGTIRRIRKFSRVTRVLGTPGTACGSIYGTWTGPMASGDVDGDGKLELVVFTIDENATANDGDDTGLYVLKLQDGVLTEVAPYPYLDKTALSGAANGIIFGGNQYLNTVVADPGDGKTRIFYSVNGNSNVHGLRTADATVESYGSLQGGQFVLADINGDGVSDVVSGGRYANNVTVYDMKNGATLWTKTVEADSSIITRVGVADLDGDLAQEIMVLTQTAQPASGFTDAYGLTVLRADGNPYVTKKGTVVEKMKLPFARREGYGMITAKDVTGDGVPEIFIVDTTSANNYYSDANSSCGYLLVVSQEGEELFHAYASTIPNAVSSPAVLFFDLDQDRLCEFLFDGKIYTAKNGTFTQVDQLPVPTGCTSLATTLMPALADLNGDQIPEIIYGCSDSTYNNGGFARQITAYDPIAKTTVSGFPQAITYDQTAQTDNTWHAGNFQHWNGSSIIVADLDGNGLWDIAVGTGAATNGTLNRPMVNVISTPYAVSPVRGRKESDIGWWSYGHTAAMDFAFPFWRNPKPGFVVIFK